MFQVVALGYCQTTVNRVLLPLLSERAFWSVSTRTLAGMNRFAVPLDAQPKEKNKQMGQVQECPEVATGLDLDFLYTNHPAKTIQPAIENRITHPPTL